MGSKDLDAERQVEGSHAERGNQRGPAQQEGRQEEVPTQSMGTS